MKGYYCTLIRDDGKVAWLLGPFDTHDEAKKHVRAAHEKAQEIDPRTFWCSFGTSSIELDGKAPHGKLNPLFPELFSSPKDRS